MPKDYAKFTVQDKNGTYLGTYCKRRLVEAVIKHYCDKNDGLTLRNLQKASFPTELQRNMEVVTFEPHDPVRYFKTPVVRLGGRALYICNQWGIGAGKIDNTNLFIKKAKELGYKIERIE